MPDLARPPSADDPPPPGGDAPHPPGGEALHRPGGEALHRPGGEAPRRPGGEAPRRPGGDPQPPLGGDAPHPPGRDRLWAESWQFDFVAAGGGPAGFVALHRYPNLGVAWYWASFLTPSGLVAVRDHEVPLPKVGLEIRTDGLWAEFVCETPLEHWSGGLEAFGIRFDEPAEAWGDEWGERLAVGLDFEWELTGPPVNGHLPGPPGDPDGGFLQPGTMWGEILVGPSVRLPFEGTGVRSRRWGVADWWPGPADPPAGSAPARRWSGAATMDGRVAIPLPDAAGERFDAGGLPVAAAGRPLLGVAPVLVTDPDGRRSHLARALCRTDDGYGWAEWLRPG